MNTNRPSEQLRRILAECGMSRYRLSKLSGVSEAALSRIVSGERGARMVTLDRLAPILGLRLVAIKRRRGTVG